MNRFAGCFVLCVALFVPVSCSSENPNFAAVEGGPVALPTEPSNDIPRQANEPRKARLHGSIDVDGNFVSSEIYSQGPNGLNVHIVPYKATTSTHSPASQAVVIGLDKSGSELFVEPFAVERSVNNGTEFIPWSPDIAGNYRVRPFYPASVELDQLILELAGKEIWRIEASDHPPNVEVSLDGTVVSWAFDDPDGDTPRFRLFLYNDAGHTVEVWQDTHFSGWQKCDQCGENWVDLSELDQFGPGGQLVAFVDDGFHYTTAEVIAPDG